MIFNLLLRREFTTSLKSKFLLNMSKTTTTTNIVLYHYPYSPYARKVYWYLKLRAIPFSQCLQPPIMPRPDLSNLLGITYRRIPLLSIDQDIYADTRLILQVLEKRFPEKLPGAVLGSGVQTGEGVSGVDGAWTRLLEDWSDQIFLTAMKLLPTDLALVKDEKFIKDRRDYAGPAAFDKEKMEAERPEALAQMRSYFHFVEHSLLAGNKKWVLGGENPSLADIMGIWPLDWALTVPNALSLPSSPPLFSSQHFPNVHAWHIRFKSLLKSGFPPTVKGEQARDLILSSASTPVLEVGFDKEDPLGLVRGETVDVVPVDSGRNHPQRGRLVGLSVEEAVVEVDVPGQGRRGLRVHFPRRGYRLVRNAEAAPAKL